MCRQMPHSQHIKTPGGIKDIMSKNLVDNIFIRVFHCDVQRQCSTAMFNDIRGVVMEGFVMSDVGKVLVLSNEETELCKYYISLSDVGFFIGSPPPGTVLVGGAHFPL